MISLENYVAQLEGAHYHNDKLEGYYYYYFEKKNLLLSTCIPPA